MKTRRAVDAYVGGALHDDAVTAATSRRQRSSAAAAAAAPAATPCSDSEILKPNFSSILPQLYTIPGRSCVDGLRQLVTFAPQVNTQAVLPTSLFVCTYATSRACWAPLRRLVRQVCLPLAASSSFNCSARDVQRFVLSAFVRVCNGVFQV